MQGVARILLVILSLLYPIAVYFGLQYADLSVVLILLVGLLALRLLTLGQSPLNHWLWLPIIASLGLFSWWANNSLGLKLYPVAINGGFLLVFAWSLFHPPSMIERLARLKTPELSPQAIAYTRKVTKVWCGFFVMNGSIALWTSLWGTDQQWALYNGAIAYCLMGSLLLGEYLYRQRVMARHHD